jgi:undecaprenyl-diphosphatase
VVKALVGRPRPANSYLFTSSFPSGHALQAMLFYGLVTVFWLLASRERRTGIPVVCACAAVILLVGFSRIYICAHYLSDVLAGYAEGVAWLALCLAVFTATRTQKHREDDLAKG